MQLCRGGSRWTPVAVTVKVLRVFLQHKPGGRESTEMMGKLITFSETWHYLWDSITQSLVVTPAPIRTPSGLATGFSDFLYLNS